MANETYTFLMEITQKGAQSLRMKIRNSELYLKEATVICFHPLAARLPKLASKLERLDYFHLSTPSTGGSFQLITRRLIVTKQASATTLHASVI